MHLAFMLVADTRDIHIHWLLSTVSLLLLTLSLTAVRIGKLCKYAKSIFIGAVLVKIICFVALTIMHFWRLH